MKAEGIINYVKNEDINEECENQFNEDQQILLTEDNDDFLDSNKNQNSTFQFQDQNLSIGYSNLANYEQNASSSSIDQKYYQDQEIYEKEESQKNYSTSNYSQKILYTSGENKQIREQIMVYGIACAVILGISNGFSILGFKVSVEKQNMQFHQFLLPQAIICIMGSIMFGGLNKVGFREDGVYSHSSFSNPGSPFVHQMLVHRAMMSILSLVCAIYSVIYLPENVSIIILMLFPFFVGLAAYIFEKERLSITQIISILVCYLGLLFVTNISILNKESHEQNIQIKVVVAFLKKHFVGIIAGIASCIFQAFNYIAARKIGTQVHSSAQTFYLGVVQMLISFFFLLFYKPQYFLFWKYHYELDSILFLFAISSLYYVSQESLSASLANLRAGTVAIFTYLSVIVFQIGYIIYRHLIVNKKLALMSIDEQNNWLKQNPIQAQFKHLYISKQQLVGLILIFICLSVMIYSINDQNKEDAVSKQQNRNKSKNDDQLNEVLCQDCKEENQQNQQKYDKRLSSKYGQRILSTQRNFQI